MYDHFSNFLNINRDIPLFKLGSLQVNKVPNDIKDYIERPFTLEEALLALQDSDSNKSPGPDGLNAACLKHCWKHLQHSFKQVLDKFHDIGSLPVGLNSSFIALIPKINNPTCPANFRPISLINSTMKIILKILASRLKTSLPHLISDKQLGFMDGRRISDAVLITSEILHSMKTKKCK